MLVLGYVTNYSYVKNTYKVGGRYLPFLFKGDDFMTEILSFIFGMSLCLNAILILVIKYYLKLKKSTKEKVLEIVDRVEAEEFLS